jgi:hypothetical protein
MCNTCSLTLGRFLPSFILGVALIGVAKHGGVWPRRASLIASTVLAGIGVVATAGTLYFTPRDVAPLLVNSSAAAFWSLVVLVAWWLSRPLVAGLPGARLAAVAEFVAHSRDYALIYEPVISDMQEEYGKALKAGRKWKARVELSRGYWRFAKTAALRLPVSLLKLIVTLWKLGS